MPKNAATGKCIRHDLVPELALGPGWMYCTECHALLPPLQRPIGDHVPELVPDTKIVRRTHVRGGRKVVVRYREFYVHCSCGDIIGPNHTSAVLAQYRRYHLRNPQVIERDDEEIPTDVDLAWGWG